MKKITVVVFFVCVGYWMFVFFGNPVMLSLIRKQAQEICEREYKGQMKVTSCYFERESEKYIAEIIDRNGISSRIVYDSHENSFQNEYRIDAENILRGYTRGKLFNALRESRYFADTPPDELVVTLSEQVNTLIGQKTLPKLEEIEILFAGDLKKEELAICIAKLREMLSGVDYTVLTVVAPCQNDYMYLRVKKAAISVDITDIAARIHRVENLTSVGNG